LYARYPSYRQDDSTSIDVQVEQCERHAAGPLAHYIDRARTGRSVAGRPEFERLPNDAAAGKIGRLFVHKFDRLGRDSAIHAVITDLEEYGVEVIRH
jgi:DNA invertase Pin-like site-specific DNA recombinase